MPLFVCAICECVENTALGLWWGRNSLKDSYKWTLKNVEFKGRGLCSECMPTEYIDGSTAGTGKWHGQFEKEHYSRVKYQSELLIG